MTTINTGPTATALHHLLAALQGATGLDPIHLLLLLVVAGAVLATATCWAIETAFKNPSSDRRQPPLRKGG